MRKVKGGSEDVIGRHLARTVGDSPAKKENQMATN